MTNAGTPDYQRGIVSAGKILHIDTGSSGSANVTPPPNAESLLIHAPWSAVSAIPIVTGLASGLEYPCSLMVGPQTQALNSYFVCAIDVATDASYSVSVGVAPGVPWYVSSDTLARQTIDPNVAQATAYPQGTLAKLAMQVAGSDGVAQRVLETDSSGRQIIILSDPNVSGQLPRVATNFTEATSNGASLTGGAPANAWYLFGGVAEVEAGGAGLVYLTGATTGGVIGRFDFTGSGSIPVNFGPLRITQGVNFNTTLAVNQSHFTLWYAPGP